MKLPIAAALALVGCGRVDFAVHPDGETALAHDEDGDGVPDAVDDCPFVFDPPQLDGTATASAMPAMSRRQIRRSTSSSTP